MEVFSGAGIVWLWRSGAPRRSRVGIELCAKGQLIQVECIGCIYFGVPCVPYGSIWCYWLLFMIAGNGIGFGRDSFLGNYHILQNYNDVIICLYICNYTNVITRWSTSSWTCWQRSPKTLGWRFMLAACLVATNMRLLFVQGFGALRYAAPKLLSDREAAWSGILLGKWSPDLPWTELSNYRHFCSLRIPQQDHTYPQFRERERNKVVLKAKAFKSFKFLKGLLETNIQPKKPDHIQGSRSAIRYHNDGEDGVSSLMLNGDVFNQRTILFTFDTCI